MSLTLSLRKKLSTAQLSILIRIMPVRRAGQSWVEFYIASRRHARAQASRQGVALWGVQQHERLLRFAGHIARMAPGRLVRKTAKYRSLQAWRAVRVALSGGGGNLQRRRQRGNRISVWETPIDRAFSRFIASFGPSCPDLKDHPDWWSLAQDRDRWRFLVQTQRDS